MAAELALVECRRRELASPGSAGISERLAAILQLANEEADQIRAEARTEGAAATRQAASAAERTVAEANQQRDLIQQEIDELATVREVLLQRLVELGTQIPRRRASSSWGTYRSWDRGRTPRSSCSTPRPSTTRWRSTTKTTKTTNRRRTPTSSPTCSPRRDRRQTTRDDPAVPTCRACVARGVPTTPDRRLLAHFSTVTGAKGDTGAVTDRNVLGGDLEPCGTDPLTGFYRDGCCTTGPEDMGSHTVCAVVTSEFLEHQRGIGNDLSTPMPQYRFPASYPATTGASPPRTGCTPITTESPRQ